MANGFGWCYAVLAAALFCPACASVASNPYEATLPDTDYNPPLPKCVVLNVEMEGNNPNVVRYALRNTCESEVALCTWPGIACARSGIKSGNEFLEPFLPALAVGFKTCPIEDIRFLGPGTSVDGQYSLPVASEDETRVLCVYACSGTGDEWKVVLHGGWVVSIWLTVPKGTT